MPLFAELFVILRCEITALNMAELYTYVEDHELAMVSKDALELLAEPLE